MTVEVLALFLLKNGQDRHRCFVVPSFCVEEPLAILIVSDRFDGDLGFAKCEIFANLNREG